MSESFLITGKTKILCVFGHPIGHSMSPIMHNAAIKDLYLDFAYIAFDVDPNSLEKAIEGIRALGILGSNVTIPHKIKIMPFLDEIDPLAERIGAINTIKNEKGILKGKNTDAVAAKMALIEAGCDLKEKKIIILGAGGAARAIAFSLADLVEKIVLLNRTEEKAKKSVNTIRRFLSGRRNDYFEQTSYNELIVNEIDVKQIFINTDNLDIKKDTESKVKSIAGSIPVKSMNTMEIYKIIQSTSIKDKK